MRARPGARLALIALMAAAPGLFGLGGPAAAAPAVDKAPAKSATRTAAVRDVTTTATAGGDEADDANCTTSRKRLWVDSEGWIVRRVTTCR